MKFNTYDRTPRVKTQKWIKIFLISFFAVLIAITLFVTILISIERQNIFLFIVCFLILLFCVLVVSAWCYNISKSYFEIDATKIKIIDYPFFKKRERSFFLNDIEKIKWQSNVKGPSYYIFKNNKNKILFRTISAPEIKSHFKGLGFKFE